MNTMISKQCLQDIETIKAEVLLDNPALIVIDGELGTGKTTFGAQYADEFNGPIPFEQFIGMGSEKFAEVYDLNKKRIKCIVYDESGDYAKASSSGSLVKNLNRIFETFRQYKIVVLLIRPRFYTIPSHLFELGVVKIIYNMERRVEKKYVKMRVYYPDRIDWLVSQADNLKKMKIPMKLVYGRVHPNRKDYFTDYGDKDRRKLLEMFSLAGKDQITKEVYLKQQGLVSFDDLVRIIGRSKAFMYNTIKKLGIKSETTYKKKKYYAKETIDIIKKEVHR